MLSRLLFLFFVLIAFPGFCQEHDKIVEKVDVVNVMVPVRVFYNGEPVKGLKKENFKIEVNGKEIAVDGFFEKRQKISTTEQAAEKEPRLFGLVFTINDYNMNLVQHLDRLFEKIIRPGDRLIIVSNNFFLGDRVVENIKKEKEKIKRILEIEAMRVKYDLRFVEFELKGLAEDMLTFIKADMGPDYPVLMQDFRAKYKEILERYKQRYANIIKTQGLRMANYLKDQDVKKWVINFHQLGMFPQLKSGRGEEDGGLAAVLEEKARSHPWLRADLFALNTMITVVEGDMVKEVGKYFLNSEVTFHTILMKGYSSEFLEFYDYKPIATEVETLMRRLTDLTGGEEMASNNVAKFIEKISEKEDVYYVLSYRSGSKKEEIKVTVHDDSGNPYRVVYDNQKRPWYMKRKLAKIERQDNPAIAIKSLSYSKGILAVHISGTKMGILEGETVEKGKIHLSIKILDSESREVTKVEKAFKCKERKFVLRMKPPALKKGTYDIVVQVTDLLTGKNDVEVERIK